jgi:predicted nucleic acid-binding Zn ribbon protein
MFWKLLLTAAVIFGAYLVIRARMRAPETTEDAPHTQAPRVSGRALRRLAYALIGLMLGGTAFYLIRSWESGREVLRVQVVNANTGVVIDYLARRRDVEGRGFRTLDGQVVRLADVERMVLVPAEPGSRP